MKFTGTDTYISTEDLSMAVNASVTLERPLLIKGEPGTGKTMLAEEVAASLKMPLIEWHIKSTTKAKQGLYEYDAVTRLRDSQLGDKRVKDISNYIEKGKLWEAFSSDKRVVLLVDEVDNVWKSIGKINLQTTKDEKMNLKFRRSIYVSENIKKGDKLSKDNIRIIRPGYGIKSKYYDNIIGKKAIKKISKGTALKFSLYK